MKKLFLFSTKLRYFWTIIPAVFLLIVAIIYNDDVDSVFKLYPLIVALSGVIVFMLLYFYRAVIISHDDLRCVGRFSSREYSTIKPRNSLVITVMKRKRASIELYGINDTKDFDWSSEDDAVEINLFRARTNASQKTIEKIITYFGFTGEEAHLALSEEGYAAESDEATLRTDVSVIEEYKQIILTFKDVTENV